jgi:hypothetical protein
LVDGVFGVDDAIMGWIECYWWKFWRKLRALTEQLPWPVALVGGFEVAIGGSALTKLEKNEVPSNHFAMPEKCLLSLTNVFLHLKTIFS